MTTVTGGETESGSLYILCDDRHSEGASPVPDAEPEIFPLLLLFSLHPQYSHLYNGVHLLL